jgi:hypothetical protein
MRRFPGARLLGLASAILIAHVGGLPPAQAKVARLPGVRYSAHSRVITLQIGPFDVPADRDREVCQYVELPWRQLPVSCFREAAGAPKRCGLSIVGSDIEMGGTGASHHFILWAYDGTAEGAAKFPAGIHDSRACLDFGPADSVNTRQVSGSQSHLQRSRLPRGLAQQVRAFTGDDGRPRGIGFILNSHFIGTGVPSQGFARIKVYVAQPHTVRTYAKLIFDAAAGSLIDVPPGEQRTTSWDWFVGGPQLPPPVTNPPLTDACVLGLSAHMHKRGVKFTTDLVDQSGTQRIYEASQYSDLPFLPFSPPKLMRRGMRFHYECTHDNGVTKPVKMGCEITAGVPPGTRQIEVALPSNFKKLDGSAHACKTDADCAGIGTGRCVPARLVFGYTSDDDMCILPGLYYDAIPDAPPGRECDLSLLKPL